MNDSPSIELYGVLGHPVAHSLSPFIMNRAFRHAGIDAVYHRFDIPPDRLQRAVDGLRTLGARGANITYPFKEDVVDLIDVPTPDATLIGAVNTLVFLQGQIVGHNTDATGAVAAIEQVAGMTPKDRHFFIFGAGGSARAAAVGLLRAGAHGVTFGVRTPRTAVGPIGRIREAFPVQYVDIVPLGDEIARDDRERAFRRAEVVINATPAGMAQVAGSAAHATGDTTDGPGGAAHATGGTASGPGGAAHATGGTAAGPGGISGTAGGSLIEDPSWIRPDQYFFDFVYYPGRTEFLETASKQGAGVIGGAALLVCQAAGSFRQWTGNDFDTAAMLEALETAFPERTLSP